LIRSGGWTALKAMRKAKIHVKSDERILGDSDFVQQTLSQRNEPFERRYALRARGVDLDQVAARVAQVLDMPVVEIWQPGKHQQLVRARSLTCFWAVRQLGLSMTSMARRLNISNAAVSKSVERGAQIAAKEGYELL
jgi:putative transposase